MAFVKTCPGLLGGSVPVFEFSAASAVLTPSMAKRNGGGPFAAAPLVQGKRDGTGTPDVLSYAPGTAISGYFYPNIDVYQGGLVLAITPEWAGNDGLQHRLLQWSTNGYLEKTTGNVITLSVASGVTVSSASIAAWTVGTTYYIVARWNSKNTLDGTNYLCISINDVHAFGRTTTYTVEAASAALQIGGSGTAYPANALLEGITFFRRVLYDGAYGTSVGAGDEVNLISV